MMHKPQLSVLSVLVALAGAGTGSAQDREPDWIKRPTTEDLQSVWPIKALREGYGGKATLSCAVTVQGTLRDCSVLEERPANGGFGGAALAITPQLLMRPAMKGGVIVESRVRIPVNFPEPPKALGSRLQPVTANGFTTRVYAGLPWRAAPTYAEMLAAYPAKAKAAKLGGTAVLDCTISKTGGITACHTLKETPESQGFGAAARTLAPRFFLAVNENSRGEPLAGSHVHLPVTFPAAALEGEAPVIGKPQFSAMPSMSDFTAVVPAAARQAQVYRARVVLSCEIGDGGALAGCKVDAEDPAGLGYGEAAVRLSPYFRMGVWTEEGLPTVGGRLRLPLRFDLEEAMRAKPAPAGS